jgi:hypothetical protein
VCVFVFEVREQNVQIHRNDRYTLLLQRLCRFLFFPTFHFLISLKVPCTIFPMAHVSLQLLAAVFGLQCIERSFASIAAIHNLHKESPLCDIDGNGFVYTEVLDFPNRKRILSSNACPNHFNKCQDEECSGPSVTRARQNAVTFDVPLYPVMAEMQVWRLPYD